VTDGGDDTPVVPGPVGVISSVWALGWLTIVAYGSWYYQS
jgi:hypothetical protein